MKTKCLLILITMTLFLSEAVAQKDQVFPISAEFKKFYMENVEQMVLNHYASLTDLISEDEEMREQRDLYKSMFLQNDMVAEIRTFAPEFFIDGTKADMLDAGQYVNELQKHFKKYREVMFTPTDIRCSNTFYMFDDFGCYNIVTYVLTITSGNKVIGKKKCQAYCLFPLRAKFTAFKMAQVQAIQNLMPRSYAQSSKTKKSSSGPVNVKQDKPARKTTSYNQTKEEQFQQAVKWYFDYEMEKSFPVFKSLVESGYVKAMAYYGNSLIYGHGCKPDTLSGCRWVAEGAENGDGYALCRMGVLYSEGIGRLVDKEKALDYYKQAEKKKEKRAYYHLGFAYYLGEGVKEVSKKKAFKYWGKGEKAGHASSKFYLALTAYIGEHNKWNKQQALSQMKMAGEKGAYCLYLLGCYYSDGTISAYSNEGKAFEYYLKAAKKNVPEAQNEVGKCYKEGIGVPAKNIEEAHSWFLKAANKGIAEAQYHCYSYYYSAKDYERAKHWLLEAYRNRWSSAIFMYAYFSYYGQMGIKQDDGQAYKDFSRVKNIHPLANYYMGMCLYEEKGVKQNYNDAFDCFNKIPTDVDAQFMLGLCYDEGHGVNVDKEKAVEYYKKVAQSKWPIKTDAMYRLAFSNWNDGQKKTAMEWADKALATGKEPEDYTVREQGKTMEQIADIYYFNEQYKDYKKAFLCYKKAAESGQPSAMSQLGYMYAMGEGEDKKDDPKAFEWFKKSADLGNRIAQSNYALYCKLGKGGPKNLKEAFKYFLMSAENGFSKAIHEVAKAYHYGNLNVPKNREKAGYWYAKLAAMTSTDEYAKQQIGELKKLKKQFPEIKL